ncbi:hydroxymethylglutaryl-CoA lyase [Gulosibacter molinativorax]|uniref:Hydroxymethylglutaryl-CoA lyase n=1 Tax=Gulosibacter molinativorax TaxID=256821 RepID=A0ABT7CB90_9MICO|nr:hydroxymethylglutaryl-CoA lyase [Gulosibacter molinativorax]MDJ1372027.1 hydroxymethylglutaryl-CoA lyase [Gulosibacter molinativorax]QUY63925.1 Hydroxymethylglutaryl-CoA lyase [Gulosibacter molinativorax]
MTRIDVTDVFLRDGLQDEDVLVATATKLEIAEGLISAGVSRLEVASFVNPKRVPQMADAAEVLAGLRAGAAEYTVLALNGKGIDRAADAGATHVQIVASASQAHSSANAGQSTEDALASLAEAVARHPEIDFFAGISTAFLCPFEGDVRADRVAGLVGAFADMGVSHVGLADTLGTAATATVIATVETVRAAHPNVPLSLHLHNAEGQALGTVIAAARAGIDRFDAALAGFGGCPFAPGAHGNIATEEIVRVLHEHGFVTGIDETRLAEVASAARAAVASSASLVG